MTIVLFIYLVFVLLIVFRRCIMWMLKLVAPYFECK